MAPFLLAALLLLCCSATSLPSPPSIAASNAEELLQALQQQQQQQQREGSGGEQQQHRHRQQQHRVALPSGTLSLGSSWPSEGLALQAGRVQLEGAGEWATVLDFAMLPKVRLALSCGEGAKCPQRTKELMCLSVCLSVCQSG